MNVGLRVGKGEGAGDGGLVGCADGLTLGADEGEALGALVRVGTAVTGVGLGVGAAVISLLQIPQVSGQASLTVLPL